MSNQEIPIEFFPNFLSQEEADFLFQQILKEVHFNKEKVFLHGAWHTPNRSIAFHSDPNISYTYSGVKKEGKPWTPILKDIKDRIETDFHIQTNAVLVNYYDSGESSMGWHTDAEPDLEKDPLIVSVSLGADRDFQIRKIQRTPDDKTQTIHLNNGSLVIMKRGMQSTWEHCIPKRMKVKEPRINLTFRTMIPQKKVKAFDLSYFTNKSAN